MVISILEAGWGQAWAVELSAQPVSTNGSNFLSGNPGAQDKTGGKRKINGAVVFFLK